MIKLIATDIDGTLVKDGSLLIDPEYMSVIDRLIDKGIIFVVCSGRQFSSEFKLFAPIKQKLLYITDGGTVVRTPKEILKTYPMDEDIWKGMCRMVRDELPCNAALARAGGMFHRRFSVLFQRSGNLCIRLRVDLVQTDRHRFSTSRIDLLAKNFSYKSIMAKSTFLSSIPGKKEDFG